MIQLHIVAYYRVAWGNLRDRILFCELGLIIGLFLLQFFLSFLSLKSKISYSPFLPWKLLLKPVWFINLQLLPGVPWNNHCSLLPLVSSIFCFRIMYEPKRAGFWTRSIFTIWLPEQVCWNRSWTLLYCCESFSGSSSTRCTVISTPWESFGCGIQ